MYSLYEATGLNVKQTEIFTTKLPAGVKSIRIAAISDVHIGATIGAKRLDKISARIQEYAPDIILIAGDLVDSNMDNREQEAKILRELQPKYGTYAVLGNHEAYNGLTNSRNFMKKSGIRLLENEAINVAGITILGVNDLTIEKMYKIPALNVAKTLKELEQSKFIIILKHRPLVRKEAEGLFDLQYSGHTHGGQIWPGVFITRLANGVWQGLNEFISEDGNKSLLYVSNGTGYWGPPMRLISQPEINIINIQRAK